MHVVQHRNMIETLKYPQTDTIRLLEFILFPQLSFGVDSHWTPRSECSHGFMPSPRSWSQCCSLCIPLLCCRPRELTQPHLASLGIGSCLLLSALPAKAPLRDENTGLSQPLQLYEQFSCYFRWALRFIQHSTHFSEISLSSLYDHELEQCTHNEINTVFLILKMYLYEHLVHRKKKTFSGCKAETFLWARCQDHLFEVVSATIQSYTICCLFTVCHKYECTKEEKMQLCFILHS